MLKAAIDDVLAGRPSRMTDADIQGALQAFSAKMQEKLAAESKAQAERNAAAGKAFLAENRSIISAIFAITPGLRYAVQATIGPIVTFGTRVAIAAISVHAS